MPLPFKSLANWDSEDQVPHWEKHCNLAYVCNINIRHMRLKTLYVFFTGKKDSSFYLPFLNPFQTYKAAVFHAARLARVLFHNCV